MSKINKLNKAIKVLSKKPYLLNKVIEDDSIYKDEIISNYKKFLFGLPVIEITDILPNLNETISPYCYLNGGSLITDLALLKGLAKKNDNCTYFEIGTWRGESVSNVANVAKQCFTLNLSNSELQKIGYNQEYLDQQGLFSKGIKNITHLKGNSFDFDFSPYYKKCDLVFIDGDHRYKSIVNDTKIAFKLLKDKHSVIVWHDYSSQPGEVRWDVLKGIIDGAPKDKIGKLFSISNTLSALYTNQSYKENQNNFITPTKKFTINIKSENI
jgi:predicted O-methyltransferase YrrM